MHLNQVEKLEGNHADRRTVIDSIGSRNGMAHCLPKRFEGAFGSLGRRVTVIFVLWRSEKSV
jgi:hypothetical protein